MNPFKITFWLTLIGGLFIVSLGYLMEYYQTESSSYVFTKVGVSGGVLTPWGAKLIGFIVLLMWLGHFLGKKNRIKEREYLENTEYKFVSIRTRKKLEERIKSKKRREKKRRKNKKN